MGITKVFKKNNGRHLRKKRLTAKSANMHIRIDPKVKADADRLFKTMGLTLSSGVSLYLQKVVNTKRIPFDLSVPNKESLRVLAKAKEGRGLHEVASTEELIKELNK